MPPRFQSQLHTTPFTARMAGRETGQRSSKLSLIILREGIPMTFDLEKLVFGLVEKLLLAAVGKRITFTLESFLTQRRITNHIESSIASVVSALVPLLENEHVSQGRIELLIATLDRELTDLISQPQDLFAGSMSGEKIFDSRYKHGGLPQEIQEEQLVDIYATVFTQIANLICLYPPAIEMWKAEGYRQGFKKLDDISNALASIFAKVNELSLTEESNADALLGRVARFLQQEAFQLELTGLRGDRPDAVPFEKCYVVPEIVNYFQDTHGVDSFQSVETPPEYAELLSVNAKRALIVGSPGSGKSILSVWLQRLMLQYKKLTVIVKLREFTETLNLPSIHDLVRSTAGVHLKEEITPEIVRKWCHAGAIQFILDGFDEVPPDKRDAFSQWAKDLSATIENAGLIITSRPLTTEHLNDFNWEDWYVSPFDLGRVTEYIGKWYKHAPLLEGNDRNVDAAKLAYSWDSDPVLSHLVGTPLMLVTLLMVHHLDGELPQGRAKLYERYVDGMLGLWQARHGVPSAISLTLESKKDLLTRVALHFHLNNKEEAADDEFQTFVGVVLPQLSCDYGVRIVIDYLLERSGLIIGPGTWSFAHKSIQEYFVANALFQGSYIDNCGLKVDRFRLFQERHNDRWNTVLFFWCGLCTRAELEAFVDELLASGKDEDILLCLGILCETTGSTRVTPTTRDLWIKDIIKHEFKSIQSGGNCIYTRSDMLRNLCPMRIAMLDDTVRGIRQLELEEALARCVQQSALPSVELIPVQEIVRARVWLMLVSNPRNSDDLHNALTDQRWIDDFAPDFFAFALGWGLDSSLSAKSTLSATEYLDTFRACCPEHSDKVSIFLLYIIFTTFCEWTPRDPPIGKISTAIALINHEESIDMGWLSHTDSLGYTDVDEELDILKGILTFLEADYIKSAFSPETLVGLKLYVERLLDLRNNTCQVSLAANEPAS